MTQIQESSPAKWGEDLLLSESNRKGHTCYLRKDKTTTSLEI